MSTDIDLLAKYMNADAGSPIELDQARQILDQAIQAEIRDSSAASMVTPRAAKRSSKVPSRLVVAGVAAVAAAVVLIIQVVPTSTSRPPVAAAAQISRLAEAVQSSPPLGAGEWSSVQMTGELLAQIGSVGTTKTPEARASIPISFGVWSNSTGTTCTSQQFGTATFASPTNSQAWRSIGLIATPANQPVTGCVAGVQAATGGGMAMTPIDVSHLTRDPSTLAKELQSGSTGIPSVDQSTRGASALQNVFARLVILIVGPTSGGWSGYDQELLQTMALLPGVVALGHMTAHSGKSGLAFSAQNVVTLDPKTGAELSNNPSPIVILDSATGALLEARNFSIPVLQSAGHDFVGSPTAPVFTQGVGYGISTQWIDPVGVPGVVATSSLPPWIGSFHMVEVVTNPTADGLAVNNITNIYLGSGNSAFDDWNTPVPGQNTFDITINDPTTNVSAMIANLTASGLFQSITEKA